MLPFGTPKSHSFSATSAVSPSVFFIFQRICRSCSSLMPLPLSAIRTWRRPASTKVWTSSFPPPAVKGVGQGVFAKRLEQHRQHRPVEGFGGDVFQYSKPAGEPHLHHREVPPPAAPAPPPAGQSAGRRSSSGTSATSRRPAAPPAPRGSGGPATGPIRGVLKRKWGLIWLR